MNNTILSNLFTELKDKGIPATIINLKPFTIQIVGFYKNGTVDIYYDDSRGYCVHRRYDDISYGDNITFDDIVYLNYLEWLSYRERYDGWKYPEECFIPYLLEKKYIVKKVITTYEEC